MLIFREIPDTGAGLCFGRVTFLSTSSQRFLVIDHNPDSGELLVRSLRRKFPAAMLTQTAEIEEATAALQSLKVTAVVLHRANDGDAVAATRALRAIDRQVPIIVVSGIDRSEAVLAAGATGFLNFDQWLMLGNVVTNSLAESAAHAPAATPTAAG